MDRKLALLTCLGATLFMTGLIWFVQAVHYPLFGRVGAGDFGRFHAEHVRRTTRVVLVPMVLELAGAAWLVARPPAGVGRGLAGAGLAAAGLAWASTALVQVPLHGRLAAGFDSAAAAALVRTNAARVAAWTLHAAILLIMAARAIP